MKVSLSLPAIPFCQSASGGFPLARCDDSSGNGGTNTTSESAAVAWGGKVAATATHLRHGESVTSLGFVPASCVGRRRAGGLSALESNCFRQHPRPSPFLEEKLSNRRTASHKTSEHRRTESPIEGTVRTPTARRAGMLEHRSPGGTPARRGRRGTTKCPNLGRRPAGLETQEEQCAEILRTIYPTTTRCTAVAAQSTQALPSVLRGPHSVTSATSSRAPSAESCSGDVVSVFATNSPSSVSTSPIASAAASPSLLTAENAGAHGDCDSTRGVLQQSSGVVSAPLAKRRVALEDGDASCLRLLRKAPSSPSASSTANAFRLLQGAAAYRQVRESVATAKGDTEDNIRHLCVFRERLLQRFSSVHVGLDTIDVDALKPLDVPEWCSVLGAGGIGLCKVREARALFDLIGADGTGLVTIADLYKAVETIAPVNSVSSLRKRLLCVGYTSVFGAIAAMDGGGTDKTMTPLNFGEFSSALRRCGILEAAEQRAVFDLVRDPLDSTGRVTLSELAFGLSTASPCLILEDFYDRFAASRGPEATCRCGSGGDAGGSSLARALECFGFVGQEQFTLAEFVAKACAELRMTEQEASTLFQLVDLGGRGLLSPSQLMISLRVSSPNLYVESFRGNVLQSYQSIERAFKEAYCGSEDDERFFQCMHFAAEEFVELLEPLQMGKRDTGRLAHLMAGCEKGVVRGAAAATAISGVVGGGSVANSAAGGRSTTSASASSAGGASVGLTLAEFVHGAMLFAPSYVLHGVRFQILQGHGRVADAFGNVMDRRAPLGRSAFRKLLGTLRVKCDSVDQLFNFLDIRASGFITVSEFVAALQCVSLGSHELTEPTAIGPKVEQRVRQELAPVHRRISDLKMRVRHGFCDGEAQDRKQNVCDMTAESPLLVPPAIAAAGNAGPAAGAAPAAATRGRKQRRSKSKTGQPSAVGRGSASQHPQDGSLALQSQLPHIGRSRSTPSRLEVTKRVSSGDPAQRVRSEGGGSGKSVPSATNTDFGRSGFSSTTMRSAARRTFQKVSTSLQKLGPDSGMDRAIHDLGGYFADKEEVLRKHAPMLQQPYKRFAMQQDFRRQLIDTAT
eukprot:TRINITY_DN36193_c0_g1_i1.p1 TRINITY_DN36193_c0_g1~~TRINITY_DN36193_c0_g1_i1.p1  ORF type:complete len:1080 (-),score=179.26 TRINITY_DN36193_c0_g1_i1:520-3759(-)